MITHSLALWLLLQNSPDLEYERGMALARSQQWEEAEKAFQAGWKKAPRDKRFPLELAGIAFKRKRFAEAKSSLKRALALDPRDPYTLDFIATLYLLDGNLEASLRYWNRLAKPAIEEVKLDPQPAVNPALLDRAFTFSPGGVLKLDELLASQARIKLLEIFSRYQFELQARPDEKFDLVFRSVEKKGLISLFRGIPYQTIYPEFFNLGGSAINITSLVRWDARKRRILAALSAPLGRNPKWRYRFYFDGRNETWVDNFHLRKVEAGAEIQTAANGRWGWSSGVHFSHRTFGNPLFRDGFSVKYRARADRELLRIPERRIAVDSFVVEQFGRFSKTEGSVAARWFPRARGDDYETAARFRAGKTFGRVPFDELFMLGLERDNDLWMRAHIGTRGGKKGSAPLGRDYLLANWEIDKTVYDGAWFKLKLGPFLDSGKIYDPVFGAHKWLWDSGLQCKLRVLGGVTVVFSYGKDLRSGNNALYALSRFD